MNILDLVFPKRCVGCRGLGSYVCASCFSSIRFIEGGVCLVCQRAAVGGMTHPVCKSKYTIDGVFSSIVYAGVVKRLVYEFKFSPYVTDMQSVLVDLLYEGLIQKEELVKRISNFQFPISNQIPIPNFKFENLGIGYKVVFVPVPLHRGKLRKRGYNQAELLARGLARRFMNIQYPTLPAGRQVSNFQFQMDQGTGDLQERIIVWEGLERVRATHTQVGLSVEERKENIRGAFVVRKEFVEKLRGVKQVFLVDDIVTSGSTLLEAANVLKREGVGKVWGITLAHGE